MILTFSGKDSGTYFFQTYLLSTVYKLLCSCYFVTMSPNNRWWQLSVSANMSPYCRFSWLLVFHYRKCHPLNLPLGFTIINSAVLNVSDG